MRTIWMAVFAVLFTTPAAFSKEKPKIPYSDTIGWKLCQDKENFDCAVVKERIIEKKRGRKTVKRHLMETWESLFPDAATRELIQKINRLNVPLKKGMPVAIPNDKTKTFMDFSPFPKTSKDLKDNFTAVEINQIPTDKKFVIFDPAHLAAAAYSPQGKLLRWMPALGGMDRCPDTWRRCRTVVGVFKFQVQGDEKSRSHIYPIGCPKKEPCALMPWFMGFYKCYPPKKMCFYGFHASKQMVGKHASHGCVRLFLDDAKWLNQNFAEIGTKVIIRKYPYPNRS